jgi:hypothetical protein
MPPSLTQKLERQIPAAILSEKMSGKNRILFLGQTSIRKMRGNCAATGKTPPFNLSDESTCVANNQDLIV